MTLKLNFQRSFTTGTLLLSTLSAGLSLGLSLSSSAFAQNDRLQIENIFSGENQEDPSLLLLIGYHNSSQTITHKEQSENVDYFPLGKSNSLSQHAFDLGIGKELFAEQYVSVTATGRVGMANGRNEVTEKSSTKISYDSKISGEYYAAGLSLNLNMEGFNIKIQPYIGAQYLINKSDYELTYARPANEKEAFLVTYTEEAKVIQSSLGIRLIDGPKHVMSFASLDYNSPLQTNLAVRGMQGKENLYLTNPSKLEYSNLTFTIGVGFVF